MKLARLFTLLLVIASGVSKAKADTPIRNSKTVAVMLFVRDAAANPLSAQSGRISSTRSFAVYASSNDTIPSS